MRVLLTGATGFLGASIAAAIRAADPSGTLIGISRAADTPVDLLDRDQVAAAVRAARPTHVVHAAGGHGQLPPKVQFEVHATATEHLLCAVGELKTTPVFVNVGSAAQYGPQAPHTRLGEDAPDRPGSAYGVAKLAQEQLVRAAERRGSIAPIYLRVFNPIGPGQSGPMLLPTILSQLRGASGARVEVVLASLEDRRDYLDVRDLGAAVVGCLESNTARGQQINVCSGTSTSVKELALALARIADLELVLSIREPRGSAPASYSCGDPARLQQLVGASCRYTLDQTLASIWAAS